MKITIIGAGVAGSVLTDILSNLGFVIIGFISNLILSSRPLIDTLELTSPPSSIVQGIYLIKLYI